MKDSRNGYTLFISLPNNTTHSLRKLSTSLPVLSIKARLEIEAGIPSDIYTLYFGESVLDEDDIIEFQGGVRNGAVLKVVIEKDWEKVYTAVQSGDVELIQEACMSSKNLGTAVKEYQDSEHEDSDEDVVSNNTLGGLQRRDAKHKKVKYLEYDDKKCFVALYMAAFAGNQNAVKEIVSLSASSILDISTPNGRTVLHAAAAADHVPILTNLIGLGASPTERDGNGFSPMDVATSNGAYIAERYLRNHIMHTRTSRHGIRIMAVTTRRPISARPTSARPSSAKKKSSPTSILTHTRSLPFNSKTTQQVQRSSTEKAKFVTLQREEKPWTQTHSSTLSSYLQSTRDGTDKSSVKPKPRIKSAPIKMPSTQENISPASPTQHNTCVSKKPFMAFRAVPFEELRPVAVEYVPLNAGRFVGTDQRTQERNIINAMAIANRPGTEPGVPKVPYSSLNNSLEDLTNLGTDSSAPPPSLPDTTSSIPVTTSSTVYHIPQQTGSSTDLGIDKAVTWVDPAIHLEKEEDENKKPPTREELFREYTKPAGTRTLRAQSAKYYRTQYHLKAEEDKYYETIPRPRPSTAGPRYRAWKTWLLQKYEEDAEKTRKEQLTAEQKKKNARAFKRWLTRKYRESEEQSESESDSDPSDNEEENAKAFEKWLSDKKQYFARLDQKRKNEGSFGNQGRDSRLSVYQIGSTDASQEHKYVDFNGYMRSHQRWQHKKKKFQGWKDRQGIPDEDTSRLSQEELAEMRRQLVLGGYTYEEWLGQKCRERSAKLHVTAFGEMSPRKW